MNEQVKELLVLAPQKLGTIQIHLGLVSRHEALEVMEKLETAGEVYCNAGVWRLINKCCRCDNPVRERIDGSGYCVTHALRLKLDKASKLHGGVA
jgi:hypothetical protein